MRVCARAEGYGEGLSQLEEEVHSRSANTTSRPRVNRRSQIHTLRVKTERKGRENRKRTAITVCPLLGLPKTFVSVIPETF